MRQCHRADDIVGAAQRIEAPVQCAVRIEPAHPVAEDAVQGAKFAADQQLAIWLKDQAVNRVGPASSRAEGGIKRASGISNRFIVEDSK